MKKNEIAYKKIKDMIFQGAITNSSAISENTLVEKLGMSRTPIRAALQRLSFEGIITIIPNQGIVIQELSLKETREKLELRVAVELYLLRKCINLICDEDIKILYEILGRQSKAISQGDFFAYFQSDIEFHTYILKNYKNETMSNIVLNFRERFFYLSLRGLAKRSGTQMEKSLDDHKAIIIALEKRNVKEASDLLEQHIENSVLELLKTR